MGKQLLNVTQEQNLVAKISLEKTVKLLFIIELDRAEQERLIKIQRIKDASLQVKRKVVDLLEN